jgi:hypothetical protein
MIITSNLENLSGKAPLFEQYPGASQPQSAHLEIYPDGKVFYESNSEIGNSIPSDVYHKRVLRISIPNHLSPLGYSQLHAYLKRKLAAIVEGMSEDWDGSNWVGRLSDDAQELLEALEFESHQGHWDDFASKMN